MTTCMTIANYDDSCIQTMRFPQKMWKIVNDCKTGAIMWNYKGSSILLGYKQFQDEYLTPKGSIFKTSNITSFIRQLNLYGFRKVTSHHRDPITNSNNPDMHEFLHENFRIDRPDLLSNVCRKMKLPTKSVEKKKPNVVIQNSKELNLPCNGEGMTKLQMCQLGLKKALDQALQQYKEDKIIKSTTEMTTETEQSSSIDDENSTDTALTFFAIDTSEESCEKSPSEPETQEIMEEVIYEIPESQFLVPISETTQGFQPYFLNRNL